MHRWKRLAVLSALVALPGCVRWRQVPVPTPPAPPNVVANLSRVRLGTGQAVEFVTLVVAPDSLFGVRNNLGRTRMAISHDQVRRIEVRQKDPLRTLGILAVLAGVVLYTGMAGVKLR
jgi:hypothetical protein